VGSGEGAVDATHHGGTAAKHKAASAQAAIIRSKYQMIRNAALAACMSVYGQTHMAASTSWPYAQPLGVRFRHRLSLVDDARHPCAPLNSKVGFSDAPFGLVAATPALTGSLIRVPLSMWTHRHAWWRHHLLLLTLAVVAPTVCFMHLQPRCNAA